MGYDFVARDAAASGAEKISRAGFSRRFRVLRPRRKKPNHYEQQNKWHGDHRGRRQDALAAENNRMINQQPFTGLRDLLSADDDIPAHHQHRKQYEHGARSDSGNKRLASGAAPDHERKHEER